MIIFFTLDAVVMQPKIGQSNFEAFLPMIFAICFWLKFTSHEIYQYIGARTEYLLRKASRNEYDRPVLAKAKMSLAKAKKELFFCFKHVFMDLWNTLDFFSLSGIFWTFVMRLFSYLHDRKYEEYVRIISAFALLMNYLNMLYYLQGFSAAGELVRMIVGITLGVRFYLVVMLVVLIGFCSAFFVLFQGAPKDFGQSSPLQSLFSGYTIMLGTFETSDFDNSVSYSSTSVLFIFFTLFINIIMLNLLITYMADIFDEIKKSAKAEFMYGRACIINEYESLRRARNDENDHALFPKWIQVLEPTGEKDEEHIEAEKSKKFEHLEMKMDKLMEMVKKEFEQQQSQNARELAASRKGLAEVKEEFSSLRDELKKE